MHEYLIPTEAVFTGRTVEHLPHPEIAVLTQTAIEAAIASAKITYNIFHGTKPEDLQVEWKEDATPKTIADVEGDLVIVQVIRTTRPQDEILIEESGYHQGLDLNKEGTHITDRLRWYADSLDGTRPFTEGKEESTTGVVVCDAEDNYIAGVIVHPFKKQLAFGIKGMGAYICKLNDDFEIMGAPEKISVSQKNTFAGATVAFDSLYTPQNAGRKERLWKAIINSAFSENGIVSRDETGSNIAYQLEVARGATLFGLTDAKGGDWDWRVGEAIITESGGVMIDPMTGKKPTSNSEVVIYGNRDIVAEALPIAHLAYDGYQGFSK